MEKQKKYAYKRVSPDNLRRLTVEECNESYWKHNNTNMRRLSDEEYDELYEIMYGQQGKKKPEDS